MGHPAAVYDALGNRVEETNSGITNDFTFGTDGRIIHYNTSSIWGLGQDVFANGQHIGNYANGDFYMAHQDQVGAIRAWSIDNGSWQTQSKWTSLPFGDATTESYNSGLLGVPNHHYFSDFRQDSDGDFKSATRRYSGTQGRWSTPDSAGLAAVDMANPQSWNTYAYVMNNPVSASDPSGLCGLVDGVPQEGCGFFSWSLNFWSFADSVRATLRNGVDNAQGAESFCPDNDCSAFETEQFVIQKQVSVSALSTWNIVTDAGLGGSNVQAANNGTWNWIKNAARKIGNYIPVSCGAGLFAYGGANVGSPASLSVAKWYQWDSIEDSSSGLFTELSGGQAVTGGVGAQATPGQNTEYYMFVGAGSKNPGSFSGNASGFVSTDFSSGGSQGFALEGAAGRSVGGVGAYMNFTSLTSCMSKVP